MQREKIISFLFNFSLELPFFFFIFWLQAKIIKRIGYVYTYKKKKNDVSKLNIYVSDVENV